MKTTIISVALIGVALFGLAMAGSVHANPSYYTGVVTTNYAATTSPAFLTPGTATTTTPIYNAYASTTNGGLTTKADSAGLLVRFCGSSTNAVLNNSVEYSQDGIDWYRNFVLDPRQTGTTTPQTIGTPFSQNWKFASSTLGGAAGADLCSTAATVIPTPFQYTRVVSSITGANGSVWVELVPIKETR